MKIRLGQLNTTIGDLEGNFELIKKAMNDAENSSVDLLILPELVVCGYPPMDLLERPQFLDAVYDINERIIGHTKNASPVLFGTVTPNTAKSGRKCYNSAILADGGEVSAVVNKALLPTYDVYDELRYFEPANTFECINFKGRKLGITVCEDIWHNFELSYLSYDVNPVKELAEAGAEAICNVSASPYAQNKPAKRQKMLQQHARKWNIPVFYANQVGGNTELVSDGDSMAIDADGDLVSRCALFEEDFTDLYWEEKEPTLRSESNDTVEVPIPIAQMFKGIKVGLRDYLKKTAISDKVILGLSGGIDSALVATIAVEALGKANVVGITMPSEFSSEGSISDSEKLAENLGIPCHELPIGEVYNQFNELLNPFFKDTDFGVAEENLQPRIRGTLLMAYSNKFGHMLLNTGNKSELATGYCTLYGDMSGGLGIIADLYKTEVYEMAHWLNNEYFNETVIPKNILEKPPSAELRPDQKDADSLPEYEVLDAILKAYIEDQASVEDITDRGYDSTVVKQIVVLVDNMEYKRFQAAPALKMSSKAFGTGRRVPIVQGWTDNRR
ncbi:NAD+ synthase [Fodinibius halophilus]|uniref:Glutamine-dependent NAD(+) synthetase n=1 Tax=Fodinibius halophilus TaxID=1736908 RepID=A0A6M1T5G3_9BACT|nr:NAD+ synthase [Fodinibius halophilus]NGP89327.1 NAD+ synthase [Fodinibius halophilus]